MATGVKNVLGNKGGVGINFKLGKTSIMCVSCHLAAGHDESERRNQDFRKIYDTLIIKKIDKDSKGVNAIAVEPTSTA